MEAIMPKLAANLSYLFQELAFLERFGAAAAAGFRGVECLFPYEAPAAAIAEELDRHDLTLALFNLPPGEFAKGERGLGALPGREGEFSAGVERALGYALLTRCRQIHALSGIWPAGRSRAEGEAVYVANLRQAADLVAPHGIALLIEP